MNRLTSTYHDSISLSDGSEGDPICHRKFWLLNATLGPGGGSDPGNAGFGGGGDDDDGGFGGGGGDGGGTLGPGGGGYHDADGSLDDGMLGGYDGDGGGDGGLDGPAGWHEADAESVGGMGSGYYGDNTGDGYTSDGGPTPGEMVANVYDDMRESAAAGDFSLSMDYKRSVLGMEFTAEYDTLDYLGDLYGDIDLGTRLGRSDFWGAVALNIIGVAVIGPMASLLGARVAALGFGSLGARGAIALGLASEFSVRYGYYRLAEHVQHMGIRNAAPQPGGWPTSQVPDFSRTMNASDMASNGYKSSINTMSDESAEKMGVDMPDVFADDMFGLDSDGWQPGGDFFNGVQAGGNLFNQIDPENPHARMLHERSKADKHMLIALQAPFSDQAGGELYEKNNALPIFG